MSRLSLRGDPVRRGRCTRSDRPNGRWAGMLTERDILGAVAGGHDLDQTLVEQA